MHSHTRIHTHTFTYTPPGYYPTHNTHNTHEVMNIDYNIDTNCLVSVIDPSSATDDDTGFR